ncbi:carotenoid oxygenase [Gonapodya prolifera JEL478]|uniref:Carotenoid oxygenase n=1 Tax=Gonapodya prolifera (strain JEL478) TaxID=1344416 RepID=A0A139AG79_GONPJ|nr:carotenoid oxygenase [Gonapodya prolifera JEL478]|eukprot:KXS15832.1 carotenoid oxygenase [Gonapodya prolifera JEL478]
MKHPYLEGNFYPQHEELSDAPCTVIEGTVPECLKGGMYIRNGSNPLHVVEGMSYHWFDGDGQLHAVRIEGEKVVYTNKFVQTVKYKLEKHLGMPSVTSIADLLGPLSTKMVAKLTRSAALYQLAIGSPGDVMTRTNTANTALVYHDGRLLALMEQGPATHMLMPTLETAGVFDYHGAAPRFTAHPKVDPRTGQMFFFSIDAPVSVSNFSWPLIKYYTVSSTGTLTTPRGIDIPLRFPIMMHDFVVTEKHAVVWDHPLVFSLPGGTTTGSRPAEVLSWRPELGTRIGVFPRSQHGSVLSEQVRWFNVDTCAVIHTATGWEEKEGGEVVLVAPRATTFDLRAMAGVEGASIGEIGQLHMWRLCLKTGKVDERSLDTTLSADFPVTNSNYACRRARYVYEGVAAGEGSIKIGGIVKFDLDAATSNPTPQLLSGEKLADRKVIKYPPGVYGGEAVFVPRKTSLSGTEEVEDDGFLVVFVRNEEAETSELHVYDAKSMDAKPVARITLPHRVPFGFHGLWVTQEQIEKQRSADVETVKKSGTKPIPNMGVVTRSLARLIGVLSK